MRIGVIDYGAGNLRSVVKAFEAVCRPRNIAVILCDDAETLEQASHIVLPGVGAFADCMRGLDALPDVRDQLERRVRYGNTPFLGICVGMQMLFERGIEHGVYEGLGWLKGEVVRLTPDGLRVPHMGWNDLQIVHPHPLLNGIADGAHAYFTHSYHCVADDAGQVAATVDYGGPVTAAVAVGHIMGTQFHPEKSQVVGLKMLENFVAMEAA